MDRLGLLVVTRRIKNRKPFNSFRTDVVVLASEAFILGFNERKNYGKKKNFEKR